MRKRAADPVRKRGSVLKYIIITDACDLGTETDKVSATGQNADTKLQPKVPAMEFTKWECLKCPTVEGFQVRILRDGE